MDIKELIEKIRNTLDCIVHAPCGLPLVNQNIDLPNELKVFYENCGGITLFANRAYGFTIVAPEEMVHLVLEEEISMAV